MMSERSLSRLEETALARLGFLGRLRSDEHRERVLDLITAAPSRDLDGFVRMAREYEALDFPEETMGIVQW